MHKNTVLIYNDEGAGKDSVEQLFNCLSYYYKSIYSIRKVDSEFILKGNWQSTCKIVCFGGGFDLGFLKKLGVFGCKLIREFVHKGGCYLGICAGAYFAARHIEFDKGGQLEVVGDRFLGFFDGKAIGPIYPGFDYNSRNGVRACPIISSRDNYVKKIAVMYEGGCMFVKSPSWESVNICYTYEINNEPAIITIRHGQGQVLLSGVHFEYCYNEIEFPLSSTVDEELRNSESDRLRLVENLLEYLNTA